MRGGNEPRRRRNEPEQTAEPSRPVPGRRRRDAGDVPTLGYIPPTPDTPAPTLVDPSGVAAGAYVQTLDRLQAATSARILLVAGVSDASAAAAILNLGVTATRLGLRAVVIDGDPSGGGPSQFLRTGTEPGLSDLAAGTATLEEASRLLRIDAGNRLPVIPAGAAVAPTTFEATAIADPIDAVGEHADLVLISVAEDDPNGRRAALAAHADGSVLVIGGSKRQRALTDAARELASLGAPVVGVVELAAPGRKRRQGRGKRTST